MSNPNKATLLSVLLACGTFCGNAGDQPIQVYSSGSTGADGPFAPQVVDRIDGPELRGVPPGTRLFRGRQDGQPRNWIFLPLPQNGVYQFTSFELPAGFEMAFDTRGTTNPGVTLLAQQDIVVGGWISVATGETLMANSPELLAATENPTIHGNFYTTLAGPGGFVGGSGVRGPGTGPLPGVGRGLAAGYSHDRRFLPVTLPLIGGSGGASGKDKPDSNSAVGSGGGGTLVLASSGTVRFTGGGVRLGGGTVFSYYNNPSNHRVVSYTGSEASVGSLAVFANEVKGNPRAVEGASNDRPDRVLMAAFDQEFYSSQRVNITPPWAVGVTGLDMPIAPSAAFVELNNQNITTNAGARVVVPANGNYPLTIETRNLPPGVVFRTTVHRLAPNGDPLGVTHVDFPATVAVSAGVCRARASIPVETGSQFVTAIATSKLQTVQCPTIRGEALDTMVVEVDLKGRQSILFRTVTGRDVPYAEVLEAARKQGKLAFLSAI